MDIGMMETWHFEYWHFGIGLTIMLVGILAFLAAITFSPDLKKHRKPK